MLPPWKLYFDGACQPVNPGGHGTYGWVLYTPGGDLVEADSGYHGSGEGVTNNVAEYAGLEGSLTRLLELGYHFHRLKVRGDSQLVINQVAGKWGGKKEHLLLARDRCQKLLDLVARNWEMEWVPRAYNSEADALSQTAGVPEGAVALPMGPKRPSTKWRQPRRGRGSFRGRHCQR